MIEIEITIVFVTAIFFSLLYMLKRNFSFSSISIGIISFAAWQTIALMWILISPMTTAYAIALFFQAIAFIFLLSSILEIFKWLDIRRGYEESDLD